MPITKTAKRALRATKRKELVNAVFSKRLEIALRNAKKAPTQAKLKAAFSLIDKAAKKGLYHKNKAARLKSAFSKLSPRKKSSTKAKKKK